MVLNKSTMLLQKLKRKRGMEKHYSIRILFKKYIKYVILYQHNFLTSIFSFRKLVLKCKVIEKKIGERQKGERGTEKEEGSVRILPTSDSLSKRSKELALNQVTSQSPKHHLVLPQEWSRLKDLSRHFPSGPDTLVGDCIKRGVTGLSQGRQCKNSTRMRDRILTLICGKFHVA